MKPTITELIDSYQAGTTTVRSTIETSLDAIEADRAKGANGLNVVVSLHDRTDLLIEADASDVRWEQIRLKQSKSRPLEGVPIIVKDNICVRGELTTAGSKILAGYRAPYNATVTDKLRAAGAIILGKGNMDEFAMGSSGENSGYGPTKNPFDTSRVPGGSSSGSTASVAAGFVPVAIGSDTGGSIRQPASFCGVVGLKPSYGRVSRHGLLAMASSLDQIGPLTTSVADAARTLEVLAGTDPLDQTTVVWPDDLVGLADELTKISPNPSLSKRGNLPLSQRACPVLDTGGIEGDLRIATFDGPPGLEGLDPQVRSLVEVTREQFTTMLPTATITSFEAIVGQAAAAEFFDLALDTYYILVPAEVSSNLARYDGIRYASQKSKDTRQKIQTLLDQYLETRSAGFGAEAKRRIMLGTHVLSSGYFDAYYKTALKARAYVEQEFVKVFATADILMGPTSPTTAFKLDERIQDPLAMYLADLYTIPANIGGVCAISVPCGTVNGLPVGMQLIAKGGDERKLLHVAHAFEATVSRSVDR